MRFLTELHAHTKETSGCGQLTAHDLVSLHTRARYSTLVITDHCCAGSGRQSVKKRTDAFLRGYRAAKKAGRKWNLRVLLGMEARLYSGPEDYLLYGLSEEDVPALIEAIEAGGGLHEFYAVASGRGLLLIQAHPNRYGCRPADSKYVDGYETLNANPRHDNDNENTRAYAEALGKPGLIMTAGSDVHRPEDVGGTGILSDGEICDNPALVAFLRKHPVPEHI